MIFAALISPAISIPIAFVCTCVLFWYWYRLGSKNFACSTRRIRRISIVVMLIAFISLAYAISFADEGINPHRYTAAWVSVITMLLVIVFLAFLDALNNMRLHRKDRQLMLAETHSKLIEAAMSAEKLNSTEGESTNKKEVTS